MTTEGYDAALGALTDLTSCERHLAACQADLDAVPREVLVPVEAEIEYRTPWWPWAIIGGLTACMFAAGGVGYYLGSR